MLMHTTAHEGCTDTVRESALKVLTLGEKSLAALGTQICLSGVPVQRSTNCATSPPLCPLRHQSSTEMVDMGILGYTFELCSKGLYTSAP